MACVLVALGMMPFSGATAPAVSSARLRVAEATGKYAVSALKTREKMRPQALLTRESFLNAITVLQAIGGSTNVVVHLLAIVNRHPKVAGTITIDTIDEIGRKTPLLVDLKPSGQNYMTDFHNSGTSFITCLLPKFTRFVLVPFVSIGNSLIHGSIGGMITLLRELTPLLHLNALTITGQTMGEALAKSTFSPVPRHLSFVQPFDDPLFPASSLVVLRGNLAPGGAVMKASASKDKRLLKHSGRAVVFANSSDLAARIDNMGKDFEITPDDVLVLQNIGPVGNPGMPESGMIPIPRKLGSRGVLDMLRISDGRMSGTAGGTVVLHISPEAADPSSVLGIVQNGDIITCDVDKRLLQVEISSEEIIRRQEERLKQLKGSNCPWQKRATMRGYRGMYMRSVNQAQDGADFNFLTAAGPSSGS